MESINNVKINHLIFIPYTNSIIKADMKYIITLPVSGSKNVSIDGIRTIINTFNINLNSSFSVLVFVLSRIYAMYKTIPTLANSLGWILPIMGMLNHALAPFIGVPKINTNNSIIFVAI